MRRAGVLLLALLALLAIPAPAASATDGQIDQVTGDGGVVEVLFSLRDLPAGEQADLDTVEASIDGEQLPAEAEPASEASVERTTMLAIDVSQSMAGVRFAQAKAAALAFVDQAPADVRIGLTTFASAAEVVEPATTDRDVLRADIQALDLTQRTELYAGIRTALGALPDDSPGSVLVLSDGKDTSGDPVRDTITAVRDSGARLDVVALEQTGAPLRVLGAIADAGSGEVTNAGDPESLTRLFQGQATILASQLIVSMPVPESWAGGDASVSVSVQAAGESYSDDAFVTLGAIQQVDERFAEETPLAVDQPLLSITKPMMLGGLGALAVGGMLLILVLTGAFSGSSKATLDDRLAPYGAGAGPGRLAHAVRPSTGPGVRQQAVDTAEKLIRAGGLDARLAKKLDAGGLKLHAAEWMLLHAGIAVGGAAVSYLLSGRLLVVVLALALGLVLPWLWLSRKEKKRIKAFDGQLADTLQLISGSLSAGLSLSQSLDTVVREGEEPVAGEFRRSLVEQRLGVNIEEALDGIAQRMRSPDFAWVVMAIRIQREVGGNLAELLVTVANTLREREYLRRQVATLSAEGRLSAWILGGLPPVFFVYLLVLRPEYLDPMLGKPLGWMMLGAATVMMTLGAFTLKKMVKVEV